MTRHEEFVARFPPVPSDAPRPRWSVLVPTYNCATYLEEALGSILAQDPGRDHMEIIVVDDCSTRDDPEEVVRRIGRGRVDFIRQQQNVGKVLNYETGLRKSRGHLIHQLHGDDRVRPGFYEAMENAFAELPETGAIFCDSFIIDESGSLTGHTGDDDSTTRLMEGWLEKIYVEQQIQTPSMVLRRNVYEQLGGFDRRLDLCEDWEMWIRVASSYPVGFLGQRLAEYRVSSSSTSTAGMVEGKVAAALREVMRIVDAYVPSDIVTRLREERNRQAAQYIAQFIPPLMRRRRYGGVARSFRDALSFSADPRTLYRLVNYTVRHRGLTGA